MQNFKYRIIQPAGFNESFIQNGKLSESEIVSEVDSYCKRLADSNVFAGNVFIADNVTILKGVSIGKNSVVGNGSIVTQSIPENVIAAGVPARVIKSLS
jgi:tetrahydrodipicolinate N-succinyltransferase